MLDPDKIATRLPQWLRVVLVGVLVVVATGAGLLAYRYFTLPTTLSVAAGSADGEAPRLMSAIASRLAATKSHVRLKVVDTGTTLEAAKTFAAGKTDLAMVRADTGDLTEARTIVLVTHLCRVDRRATRLFHREHGRSQGQDRRRDWWGSQSSCC